MQRGAFPPRVSQGLNLLVGFILSVVRLPSPLVFVFVGLRAEKGHAGRGAFPPPPQPPSLVSARIPSEMFLLMLDLPCAPGKDGGPQPGLNGVLTHSGAESRFVTRGPEAGRLLEAVTVAWPKVGEWECMPVQDTGNHGCERDLNRNCLFPD